MVGSFQYPSKAIADTYQPMYGSESTAAPKPAFDMGELFPDLQL
jgi:hypothetical protein